MTSIVIELQRAALDRGVPVSDLLRTALVVARKLSLADFQEWINHELGGYTGKAKLPEYRELRGQVRAWNPVRGWTPVIFGDPKLGELCSRGICAQSIAEVEHLNAASGVAFQMPFSQEVQRSLAKDANFDTEYSLFIPQASLARIIDSVRTIILNWALKLQEDGVLGEGLDFTSDEKRTATNRPQNINNFYGPVHGAQIQQNSPGAVQLNGPTPLDAAAVLAFLEELKRSVELLGLNPDARLEVEAEVRTVEAQLESPKPKQRILRDTLSSLRSILEQAAGSVAGQLLLNGIDKLL
jgi:hypothetical protein